MIKDFLRPRLARLGKIRLGKRAISPNSGKEHPADLPVFRVPEEVEAVYGDSPSEIDVMVPSANIEEFCPVELQRWGTGEKKLCHGDGETALAWSDQAAGWQEIECAYKECPHFKKGDCAERGTLQLILPHVSLAGVYQIDTGSWYGINNVYSEFQTFVQILTNLTGNSDAVRAVIFKLTREEQTLQYFDERSGQRKSVTKSILHLRAPAINMERAQQLAAQFRGNQAPLLSSGESMALPPMGSDERVLPQLPPQAELPEPVDECPADLVAGASPVGPDLGQKSAWAALLEQVAEMGKDVGRFESTICRNVNREASRFDDLAGETEAPVALQQAADAIANYHAKQQQEQPAPEPQPEPEPQQPAATAAKAQPRRSSKQQQADAPAQAADGGSLGF